MDDVLQWSAVTLVGLVLWVLVLVSRRKIARWSARVPSAPLGQAVNSFDPKARASAQKSAEPPTKAPDAAIRLTYRGVSYLRWR
ncbi:hypothetical protein [Thermoleptolyngbya sp. C42_A2020_037]|uniref:hypothetical protein n=1 Tax=Thermoleptolyngbya sp. C42_A2020_037 TaxID=2747799 RepID=UPI0019EAB8C8|nr:hypothetical protein [Thermoleptolyngbya sp. C42_A2020_037]MBF2084803.1 hypothetical protein [Thermoleptolyngbya sp. C42_A2020_037]